MFLISCFSKALLLLAVCQDLGMFFVNGKSRLKESRIQAVRGQILTKLGLTSPPDEGARVRPKREELEAFKAVRNEAFQHQNVDENCIRNDKSASYFAKSIVSLHLVQRTGKTIQYEDPAKKRVHIVDINTLTFDATQLDGEHHIEKAEMRIDPNYFPTIQGTTIKACMVDRLSSSSIHNTCSQVLDSKFIDSQADINLDVTDAVKKRVMAPKSMAFVKVIQMGMEQNGYDSSSTLSWEPYVLVWYIPMNRYTIERRRRHRRSLDLAFCNQRPTEKRCCLRSLYIDFQKDLKWNWIHAPLGFHANYCKGTCPFLWGSSNQTHHTSIMALYNSINPNAPSEPCCVASSYKPLVILHYVKGQPKIEQLNNMVVTSCTCL